MSQRLDTAMDLYRNGDLEKAKQMYLEILAEDPGHLGAIGGLVSVLAQREEHEVLIQLLQRSLVRYPDHAVLISQLAICYQERGEIDQALMLYHLAAQKQGDLLPAYVHAA